MKTAERFYYILAACLLLSAMAIPDHPWMVLPGLASATGLFLTLRWLTR